MASLTHHAPAECIERYCNDVDGGMGLSFGRVAAAVVHSTGNAWMVDVEFLIFHYY